MKGPKTADTKLESLPSTAAEFIQLVIKKMRYRKHVRGEVMAELTAHLHDALKDCETDDERENRARKLIAEFGDAKLLAVLLRRAKKRCRPLWRTAVAMVLRTAAVLTLCLIAYIAWFFTGKAVITTDYLAELNRIVKPSADETLNAAPFYDKAMDLWVEIPQEHLEVFWIAEERKDLTPEQAEALENWIKANELCLEQIRLGSKKPHYWRKYVAQSDDMLSVQIPSLSEYRTMARLLVLKARENAHQAHVKPAIDDILVCFRLGMHLKTTTMLIEQLLGMSIENMAVDTALALLGEVDIDDLTLTDFQQRFQEPLDHDNFTVQFEGEKLCLYDEIQRCFTDGPDGGHLIPKRLMQTAGVMQMITALSASKHGGPAAKRPQPGWVRKAVSEAWNRIRSFVDTAEQTGDLAGKYGYILFLHPDKQQTSEAAEELYAYWEKLRFKTPAQIRSQGIDPEEEASEFASGNLLLTMFLPPFDHVIERYHRNKTSAHALLTVVALLRYKKNQGSYPQSLQELVTTGYLKELPIDPYSDATLVYLRMEADFSLYSVGRNFEDDGGRVFRDDRGQVKRWAREADAVFWPGETYEQREKTLDERTDQPGVRRDRNP
ncbi:MAG: hypothetical protein ACYS29_09200 [Planctomycetota bacterium]|jgi:hypothetical protein